MENTKIIKKIKRNKILNFLFIIVVIALLVFLMVQNIFTIDRRIHTDGESIGGWMLFTYMLVAPFWRNNCSCIF